MKNKLPYEKRVTSILFSCFYKTDQGKPFLLAYFTVCSKLRDQRHSGDECGKKRTHPGIKQKRRTNWTFEFSKHINPSSVGNQAVYLPRSSGVENCRRPVGLLLNFPLPIVERAKPAERNQSNDKLFFLQIYDSDGKYARFRIGFQFNEGEEKGIHFIPNSQSCMNFKIKKLNPNWWFYKYRI